MDFILNTPRILILMNSYSNKNILIDMGKLQMNTNSNDNRNCSSIKQHEITFDNFSHTDDEPCPITFCERLCFEMTTDLDETRLQVFFLPINVHVEDSIVVNRHLSTGCLQLSGVVICGHAMLSREGLPPEREVLEYAWQMEIILGKILARLTTIQTAPIRLCMCNMHTSLCNENLTLKVGTIHIRQLLRLYPGSWLETGSISVPELRVNAKFKCHPAIINEQLEFLRRHDQHSQRLHFLYNRKSQQTLNIPTILTNLKRPSYVGLATNSNILSCACLGGSTNYYTLVQGEQFFKSTFRLSEQSLFIRSLFHPELHVLHSHFIFEHIKRLHDELDDEETFYLFDFCGQQKQSNEQYQNINDNLLRRRSDDYLAFNEHLSLTSASQTSLNSTLNNNTNNIMESLLISSLTMMQQQSSPIHSDLNIFLTSIGNKQNLSPNSSIDSLTALGEILQRQQTRNS
ncbi:unnamed protein product [Adineta steineri]|uniref:Uncharacterized protein n=1 Tax=Adineta steineri TaxID=433720 RepID=A0A816DDZ0_9BILA|nr:unnamed protein product [Adineta steineri]CAF1635091.1 unnamed protein product [Adineta steineri]